MNSFCAHSNIIFLMTHVCVNWNEVVIGQSIWRQPMTWTKGDIMSTASLLTNLIKIQTVIWVTYSDTCNLQKTASLFMSQNLHFWTYNNPKLVLSKPSRVLSISDLISQGANLTHLGPGKWPPFRWRHFQMHFHELKVLYFDSDFTEVCS